MISASWRRVRLFPYCTFGAAKDVDAELVEKFRKVLVELTPETTVEDRR